MFSLHIFHITNIIDGLKMTMCAVCCKYFTGMIYPTCGKCADAANSDLQRFIIDSTLNERKGVLIDALHDLEKKLKDETQEQLLLPNALDNNCSRIPSSNTLREYHRVFDQICAINLQLYPIVTFATFSEPIPVYDSDAETVYSDEEDYKKQQ
jgi:hypothetical protein